MSNQDIDAVSKAIGSLSEVELVSINAPGQSKAKANEDTLMAAALDAGADDLRDDGDSWEVLSAPELFPSVKEAVDKLNIELASAEVAFLPKNMVSLEGRPAQSFLKLLDLLEEHDDVQHVWSNADIDDKELEAFA